MKTFKEILQEINQRKFFDFPNINVEPFSHSEISNIEECYEGFEYITDQIFNILQIIIWMVDEQSVVQEIFRESIDSSWKDANNIINKCYNNVQLISATIREFLNNNGRIVRPKIQYDITEDNCNNLKNRVNSTTDHVEYIIGKYNDKNNKDKNPHTFPPLDDSVNIYNMSVTSFNIALNSYRQYKNIDENDLPNAELADTK
jgi:hypothetical protein